MRKALLWLCACVIALSALSLGVFAEETVIYENDFSDATTISDFKSYRLGWEIKDGHLYMTDKQDSDIPAQDMKTTFAHIIWQAPKALPENYVVEADVYNAQTSTGIIFNAEQDKIDNSSSNSFYGYLAFLANDATKGALGSAAHDGGWKGNINVGAASADAGVGANVHIKVAVNGDKIKVDITNIDTKAVVYSYSYTKGSSANDADFASGTVGFRMRAQYASNGGNSVGTTYFDNFKISTSETVLPVLTEVYQGYNGGGDGLTDASPIGGNNGAQGVSDALALIPNGGTLYAATGKKIAIQNTEFTFPATKNPIVIKAVAYDAAATGNANNAFKMTAGTGKSDSITLAEGAQVTFDNITIVTEGSGTAQIIVSKDATLTITDNVNPILYNASAHFRIIVEKGGKVVLGEKAQKTFPITNKGGTIEGTGLYTGITPAESLTKTYDGVEVQYALAGGAALPSGVTVKTAPKATIKNASTYTDVTTVLTASGYADLTLIVPTVTVNKAALTASNFATAKDGAAYKITYTLTGVIGSEDVTLSAPIANITADKNITVELAGADKGNYTLSTLTYAVDTKATESSYTVKYFKDGTEVTADAKTTTSITPVTLTSANLDALKKTYKGYDFVSVTDKDGKEITEITTETNTEIRFNYKKSESGTNGEVVYLLVKALRDNRTAKSTTIHFATLGGVRLPSIVGAKNGVIALPAPQDKPGYTFGGWYLDINCTKPVASGAVLSGEVTLFAKWIKN